MNNSQESNSEGSSYEHSTNHLPIITLSEDNKYQLRLYPNNLDHKFILDLRWSADTKNIPTIQIGQYQHHLQQNQVDGSSTPDSEDCHLPVAKKSKVSHSQEQFPNHFSTIVSKDSLPLLQLTNSKHPFTDAVLSKGSHNDSSIQLPHEGLDSLLEFPRIPLTASASSTTVLTADKTTSSGLETRIEKLENMMIDIHNMIQDIHSTYCMKKEPECEPQMQLSDNPDEPHQPEIETVIHYAQSNSPMNSNIFSIPQTSHGNNCIGIEKTMIIDLPNENQVVELKRRSNTRRNFAAKLALRIFTEEGLMLNNSSGKCPEGTIGKLDSTKMLLIKSLVFQHWPMCESEGFTEDDFWKQECMRAIDEKGRYLRFQKKSTYKKMLRKRGVDRLTSNESSQINLNSINTSIPISLNNFNTHDFCLNPSVTNYMTQLTELNESMLPNPMTNPNSLIFSPGGDIVTSPSKIINKSF